jgi:Rad3-related DNA helicase
MENTAALIFDEAHRLEDTGYYSLQTEIDTNRMNAAIESFQNVHTSLHNFVKETKITNEQINEDVIKLRKIIHNTRKYGEDFLYELTNWIIKNSQKENQSQSSMVSIGYRDEPFSSFDSFNGLVFNLSEFCCVIREIENKYSDTITEKTVKSFIFFAQKTSQQLKADIEYICRAKTPGDIFWAQCPTNKKWVKLTATTTDICGFLNPFWKRYAKPVIFTSATLSPQKNIEYFANRIGIQDLNPILKEFEQKGDIKDKIFFAAPANCPEINSHEHNIYACETIKSIRDRYKKNILVLFTNNECLESAYEELTKENKHCDVLAQGISGNNAWIQKQMKERDNCILLGGGSFWEGVDMPGKQCEILIIDKLPFAVPSHPLQKQLADNSQKDGQNGFISYFLPEALLKFRQGIGRLIRKETDKGALFVLDDRIVSKSYGNNFANIAGGCLNEFNNISDIFDKLEEFFK